MNRSDWIEHLCIWARTALMPPYVPAGNDVNHCDRLASYWGPKIATFLEFDMDLYQLVCWLHELERSTRIQERVEQEYNHFSKGIYEKWLRSLLVNEEGLSTSDIEVVVKTLLEHSKFKDGADDPPVLHALRIADKVDRLAFPTMGITSAAAMRGYQVVAYDPNRPFGYDSTEEGKLRSIYNDHYRQLEWYAMLPSDEARALVPDDSMRFYVAFLRRHAAFIAEVTGKENLVEKDLEKALGEYYHMFA